MTTESFCKVVWNLSYSQVRKSIDKSSYTSFDIPKKNGFRTITVLPETSQFYSIQKSFNKYYLKKQSLPICVKGFVEGESYISYLEPHIGSQFFVRLDIKDFFPSITKSIIQETFSHLISFDNEEDKSKILELISDICTYNDVLPQGVSTSPAISNIVMTRIDQRITKYCQSLDIMYSRYADDMLFSSRTYNFKENKWFIKKIKHILSSLNFQLNYNKLKFGKEEISLNGYVVSNAGVRLSRRRLIDVKKIVAFSNANHGLSKNRPDEFLRLANSLNLEYRDLAVYPFTTIFQFTQFLIGYRSYLISFLRYDLDDSFRKTTQRLINKIEEQVQLY